MLIRMQEHTFISDMQYTKAVELLKQLIAAPSFSGSENIAAQHIEQYLQNESIPFFRKGNNVWAKNRHFDSTKPAILLNSHLDTVRPNKSYTLNPFEAIVKEDKLYGLGSNDAGGALVSLMTVFTHYYNRQNLSHNVIFAATAEEENSGSNGIESVLQELGEISFALVGEPTQMHLAIAEKGLLVLDCIARGKSGHAARDEGENALYKALPDVEWFRTYNFPKISAMLGAVKMSVTQIQCGTQHNMVPDVCHFTVDVRCTDAYTLEEILDVIRAHVSCEVIPRSMRLRPSAISKEHPVVQAGILLGRKMYGSPTTSDQALMPFPSLKIGPGDSARSHTADEFIFLHEIKEGIALYIRLLDSIIYT